MSLGSNGVDWVCSLRKTLWQNQPQLHQLKCPDPFSEGRKDSTTLQTVKPHGLLGKVPIKPPNSGSKQGTSYEDESRDTSADNFTSQA
jgi:hypothetical protein